MEATEATTVTPVTTTDHHLSPFTWAVSMAGRHPWAGAVGWGILVSVTAALILGVAVDLRWLIITFMLLLIVCPMVLAFLFIVYGTLPLNSLNLARHSIAFFPAELVLTVRHGPEETAREIRISEISGWGYGDVGIWVDIDWKNHPNTLFIPAKAFADNESFRQAAGYLGRMAENSSGLHNEPNITQNEHTTDITR